MPLGLISISAGILTFIFAVVIVLMRDRETIVVGAIAYGISGAINIRQGSWMRAASIAFGKLAASGRQDRYVLMEGMRNLHYLFRLWGVFSFMGLALLLLAVLLGLVLPMLLMMPR